MKMRIYRKTNKRIKPNWLIVAGIVLLASFVTTTFKTKESVTLPKKMVGEWITDSPKYAYRYFALDRQLLTFATAKNDFDMFRITDAQMKAGRQGDAYILTYADEQGIKYRFAFQYFPDEGEGGAIRIKNKNGIVWIKKKKHQERES